MIENFFNISEPEQYDCLIRNYGAGHSKMRIRVRHKIDPKDTFYIGFTSVAYFCGPMSWSGADFIIKPDDEVLVILRRIEKYDKKTDEQLLAIPPFRLYERSAPRQTIQIVARSSFVER